LPLRMHTYDTGVQVLQLKSCSLEETLKTTKLALKEAVHTGLTAEEMSRLAGVSLALARERLLHAVSVGAAARDDSVEGLRFWPNKFLQTVS